MILREVVVTMRQRILRILVSCTAPAALVVAAGVKWKV